MSKPQVTRAGILDMQVCAPKEWLDVQAKTFADRENPCGTTGGWYIRNEGSKLLQGAPERRQCHDDPNMVHIMLDA